MIKLNASLWKMMTDGVDDKYHEPRGADIIMHSYALSWLKLHQLQAGGHHGKCRDMYPRPHSIGCKAYSINTFLEGLQCSHPLIIN